MCAVSPVVHTSNISSCQKKKNFFFFSFPVAVNNTIKVGTLVFLLLMFVMTENIMKPPVQFYLFVCVCVCECGNCFLKLKVNLS